MRISKDRIRDRVGAYRKPEIPFVDFVEEAWPCVESKKFISNWHIEKIAEVLESVARDCQAGIAREVAINVPPAMTKSLLGSVLWPAWVWSWWAESKWITATGEQRLTLKHGRLMRDLILHPWYQASWPLQLTKTADGETINERGGLRISASVGGSITGHHGDFHLGDDLIKEQDSRGAKISVARSMREASDFWTMTLETRKTGDHTARVLLGQRLHVLDPYGAAIKSGYESIVFPMSFDPARADPLDPRTEPGELLHPKRRDKDAVEKLRQRLGPRAAGAQLDQNPSPEGGTVLSPAWLTHRWTQLPAALRLALDTGRPGKDQNWITAWDLTFKGELRSDFVVGQLWCKYYGNFYLVDQVRGRWKFTVTKKAIADFSRRYPIARRHIIEDAANAAAVEDDLRNEIPGLLLEPIGGGCYARTEAVSGYWAAGNVLIPADAPWIGGSDGFVAEHETFSGSAADTDDQVACSSLALVHLTAYTPRWEKLMKAAREEGR